MVQPLHTTGPCITNVFVTRRKNFSQWHCSFQRKLLSHWLKFLRHVAITLVIQGPGQWQMSKLKLNSQKVTHSLLYMWAMGLLWVYLRIMSSQCWHSNHFEQRLISAKDGYCDLTHWGLNNMAAILQTFWMLFYENHCICIKNSLNFVPEGWIDNESGNDLAPTGAKSLLEPMMTMLHHTLCNP